MAESEVDLGIRHQYRYLRNSLDHGNLPKAAMHEHESAPSPKQTNKEGKLPRNSVSHKAFESLTTT